MKKILLIVTLFSSFAFPEGNLLSSLLVNKDTVINVPVKPAAADSVSISELVKKQIEQAQAGVINSSMNFQIPVKAVPEPVKIKKQQITPGAFDNLLVILNSFNKKFANIIFFAAGSFLILGVVMGRRVVKGNFGSKKQLKRSINILRAEKPIHIRNKKLIQLRKKLAESSDLYDISESTVSGKAKNLKVGKGELMLAAKVKAFQLSRIGR